MSRRATAPLVAFSEKTTVLTPSCAFTPTTPAIGRWRLPLSTGSSHRDLISPDQQPSCSTYHFIRGRAVKPWATIEAATVHSVSVMSVAARSGASPCRTA